MSRMLSNSQTQPQAPRLLLGTERLIMNALARLFFVLSRSHRVLSQQEQRQVQQRPDAVVIWQCNAGKLVEYVKVCLPAQ